MIRYPVLFLGESNAVSGIRAPWQTMASGHELSCSVPTEFDGDGTHPSPEDYFLLAIQNCFVATFKVFAEYSKLTYSGLDVSSELVVDRSESGKVTMTELRLHIRLSGVSDEKKARLLVDKTLNTGFIIQSVKTEIIPLITIFS